MLITINSKLLKKLIDVRPIYTVAANQFSLSNVNSENANDAPNSDDIFKFYNEASPDFSAKYRPLGDQDYQKYFSSRAMRREPALTRVISEYPLFAFELFDHKSEIKMVPNIEAKDST